MELRIQVVSYLFSLLLRPVDIMSIISTGLWDGIILTVWEGFSLPCSVKVW